MVPLPTNPRFINLLGQQFQRLTVQEYLGKKGGKSYWKCLCECGGFSEPRTVDLLSSNGPKSCGCWRVDYHRTHGMSGTPEYQAWHKMVNRCTNPKDRAYHYYGGRGIRVCTRWMVFAHFFDDMPLRPSPVYSLDRIENNGHYSCGHCDDCLTQGWAFNCRWTTKAEQMRNRRNTNWITFAGITLCATDWGHLFNRAPSTMILQHRQRLIHQ